MAETACEKKKASLEKAESAVKETEAALESARKRDEASRTNLAAAIVALKEADDEQDAARTANEEDASQLPPKLDVADLDDQLGAITTTTWESMDGERATAECAMFGQLLPHLKALIAASGATEAPKDTAPAKVHVKKEPIIVILLSDGDGNDDDIAEVETFTDEEPLETGIHPPTLDVQEVIHCMWRHIKVIKHHMKDGAQHHLERLAFLVRQATIDEAHELTKQTLFCISIKTRV